MFAALKFYFYKVTKVAHALCRAFFMPENIHNMRCSTPCIRYNGVGKPCR
jgi:hypothetical protein